MPVEPEFGNKAINALCEEWLFLEMIKAIFRFLRNVFASLSVAGICCMLQNCRSAQEK